MSARDVILARIRAARPAPVERPDVRAAVAGLPPQADAVRSFIEAAEAAAARVLEGRRAELTTLIASVYPAIRRQVSAMEELDAGTMAELPHSFADTDVFVCEAVLGVAENGAVWLPLSRLRHRSALFLATNVIVVLDQARIVGNLHDAYATIDVAADGFGAFVSGPSKTADIEQALVIGAHGAKSLTILLLEE
jgi:L-lactate dehydrogenase complex protein LldG